MEQRVCTYCGNPLEPGTGRLFIKRDGSTYYFDTRKCQVGLLKHKRVPRYVKWTRHYPRKGHEAEEELATEMAKREQEIAEHEAEIVEAGGGKKAPEPKAKATKAE